MTFQATLPVLCAMALARLATVGGTPVAGLLAAALLGFNLVTHVAFVTGRERRTPASRRRGHRTARGARDPFLLRGRANRAGHHVRVERARALHRLRRVPELCVPRSRRPRRGSLGGGDRHASRSATASPRCHGRGARPRRRPVQAGGRRRLRDLPQLRGAGSRPADRPGGMGRAGLVPVRRRGTGARPPRVDPLDRPPADRPVVRAGPRADIPGRATDAGRRSLARRSARWGSASRPPSTARRGRTVASVREVLPGLHWWKGHPRLDDSGEGHRPHGASAHSLRAARRDRDGGPRRAVEHCRAVRLRGGRRRRGSLRPRPPRPRPPPSAT